MTAYRAVAALCGFALALWLAPSLQRPVSPGELPGAMQAAGLDPAGPIEQLAFVVALTFLAAAVPALLRVSLPRMPWQSGPRFHDVVLLPTVLSLYFAGLDLWRGHPRLLLAVAIAVVALIRAFVPARAFALAPLALLFQLGWLPGRTAGFAAIVWIVVTPLLMREIRIPRLTPWIYGLAVFAYPLALLGVSPPPYLDFFEDGHELVVAGELARGERPYADVVPVHGLLSDGGIDWLVVKSGGASTGDILRVKRVLSALNLVAIYAVVLAATGSAEMGLLAAFLAVALIPSATLWVRTIPALFALAATAAAIRLRSKRWLVAAGVLTVVAFLFGMEFAIYSGVVALCVAIRMRAIRPLLLGIAAAGLAVIAALALLGDAGAFLRTTFFELLPAGRVYVPGPLRFPTARVVFALWAAALVVAAATTRRTIRRSEALWALALWAVVAGLSYAQRRHEYASFVLPALIVAAIWIVAHRSRVAAIAIAVLALVLAHPFAHVFEVATPLRLAGGAQPGVSPIVDGAAVRPEIGAGIDAARRFVNTTLRPGETWFDFSNSPALYFLLRRACPTRHHQVAFYETAAAQREVIAALERDRSVRAVLIACAGGEASIDGVPNRARAPLVWQYLQSHFSPAFEQNGVVFWIRR